MIRRDLLTGHWEPYLLRAISLKPCYEGGINGGEVLSFCLEFCCWLKFRVNNVQNKSSRTNSKVEGGNL